VSVLVDVVLRHEEKEKKNKSKEMFIKCHIYSIGIIPYKYYIVKQKKNEKFILIIDRSLLLTAWVRKFEVEKVK
jgi:hypothetical protein